MKKKHAAIESLGVGNLIIEMSKNQGVRKIASHLEKNGYLYKGKPISKDAVHRYLTDYRKKLVTPTPPAIFPPSATPVAEDPGLLDVNQELIHTFNSCKRAFDGQMTALDIALQNGKHLDSNAIRALMTTARVLLDFLEQYIHQTQGLVSGESVKVYIYQYNAVTFNLVKSTAEEAIRHESDKKRFIRLLGERLQDPPWELLQQTPIPD